MQRSYQEKSHGVHLCLVLTTLFFNTGVYNGKSIFVTNFFLCSIMSKSYDTAINVFV